MIVRNKIPDEEKRNKLKVYLILLLVGPPIVIFFAHIAMVIISDINYTSKYNGKSYYLQQKNQLEALKGCKLNLQEIGKAVEKYKNKNGKYPKSINDLMPKYLKSIPACSVNTSGLNYIDGYEYKNKEFKLSGNKYPGEEFKYTLEIPDCFTVTCSGTGHWITGERMDLPRYSSKYGIE